MAFAHRTFAWDSQTPRQAAVHCMIVGFDRDRAARARLFDYENPRAEPREVPVSQGINAYLVDGPNLLVEKRSKELSPALTRPRTGPSPQTADSCFWSRRTTPSSWPIQWQPCTSTPTWEPANCCTTRTASACGWKAWTREIYAIPHY